VRIAVGSFAHESAARYVRNLRARPDVDVITADPGAPRDDPARGAALALDLGVAHQEGWDELFARRPDAVVVTCETARHRDLVERAAAAGAHVLCEPPLATCETDAQAIEACARAGVGLTIACPVRFSPAFAAGRRAVADGTLGRLITVYGTHDSVNPTRARAWTADPALSGGGVIAANAGHLTDLVDVLLDGEPAAEVYAQANSLLDEATAVESAALVTVRYPSGIAATFGCSWCRSTTHPARDEPTMTLAGERATLEFNPCPRLLGGFDSTQARDRCETSGADLDAAMLDEFLAAVRTGRQADPNGAAGLRTLRIILAAYRSLRTGQPVPANVPAAHPESGTCSCGPSCLCFSAGQPSSAI
jgi:predicted dehydrogenase